MPQVRFDKAVENGYLAIVRPDDDRLGAIAQAQPAVDRLLSSFTDQFGVEQHPSALLRRSDAPPGVDYYAAVCFRNAVAISAVLDAWTMRFAGKHARTHFPFWSDYFDFYSFVPTKDGDSLHAYSPAIQNMDSSNEFRGQTAPHLPSATSLSFGLAEDIREGCFASWRELFVEGVNDTAHQRLFRSLETACDACRVPAVGSRRPSIHDVGRNVGLWVSALEILCHPGTGEANRDIVLTHLGQIEWGEDRLAELCYTLLNSRGGVLRDSSGADRHFNFVQMLCGELYRARNDFLHGNPVTPSSLHPAQNEQAPVLLYSAPLVYRAALAAHFPTESAGDSDIARDTLRWSMWHRYERALCTIREEDETA